MRLNRTEFKGVFVKSAYDENTDTILENENRSAAGYLCRFMRGDHRDGWLDLTVNSMVEPCTGVPRRRCEVLIGYNWYGS